MGKIVGGKGKMVRGRGKMVRGRGKRGGGWMEKMGGGREENRHIRRPRTTVQPVIFADIYFCKFFSFVKLASVSHLRKYWSGKSFGTNDSRTCRLHREERKWQRFVSAVEAAPNEPCDIHTIHHVLPGCRLGASRAMHYLKVTSLISIMPYSVDITHVLVSLTKQSTSLASETSSREV